jgi:ketosteroid isomerase-like protein
MRSMLKVSLGICVLAGMLGMSGRQAMAQATPKTGEQAVRSVLEEQVADWNNGDIPAFMKGYWKSEETEFVNSAGIFRGWQNVMDRYLRTYPDHAAMGQLTFSDLEIHVLCADAAYVMGHWKLDRQAGQIAGVFTLIFRKFPDGWKIINDHTSQYSAAAETKKP